MPTSYYPPTNEGRAEFWERLRTAPAVAALTAAGTSASDLTLIANDSLLGVYVYRGIRQPFDEVYKQIIAFGNDIANSPDGTPTPTKPTIPALSDIPDVAQVCGLEARRIKWVQRLKAQTLYTIEIGIACGVEVNVTPFDPTTYQAVISTLTSPAAHVLAGKFRKAGGAVAAMNIYGRKAGTVDFAMLKTCLTSPFTLTVPLAGSAPEAWEFHGRAVIRDVEIGLPSAILPALIHG